MTGRRSNQLSYAPSDGSVWHADPGVIGALAGRRSAMYIGLGTLLIIIILLIILL